MSSSGLAIWTEGSGIIGLGHLMESIALARHLRSDLGVAPLFLVNDDPLVDARLAREEFEVLVYRKPEDTQALAEELWGRSFGTVLFDVRYLEPWRLAVFKERGFSVLCIEEFGAEGLAADAVINPTLIEGWHRYTFSNGLGACYLGPEYMILDRSFRHHHLKEKSVEEKGSKLLAAMGGVDRSGSTLKIARALGDEVDLTVVVGSGFPYLEELAALHRPRLSVLSDVDNMAELMHGSDMVFSAGGNTMYELACVGVPGIVLYEDEHEGLQAEAFAQMGCVVNLGRGPEVNEEAVREEALHLLEDGERRRRMSEAGRRLVDGRGAERIGAVLAPFLARGR